MVKSIEKTFLNFNQAYNKSLFDLSFKPDTVRTFELKRDLVSRQFMMKIFEYLTKRPTKY